MEQLEIKKPPFERRLKRFISVKLFINDVRCFINGCVVCGTLTRSNFQYKCVFDAVNVESIFSTISSKSMPDRRGVKVTGNL